jgi:hypothetical protein
VVRGNTNLLIKRAPAREVEHVQDRHGVLARDGDVVDELAVPCFHHTGQKKKPIKDEASDENRLYFPSVVRELPATSQML